MILQTKAHLKENFVLLLVYAQVPALTFAIIRDALVVGIIMRHHRARQEDHLRVWETEKILKVAIQSTNARRELATIVIVNGARNLTVVETGCAMNVLVMNVPPVRATARRLFVLAFAVAVAATEWKWRKKN